MRHVISSACTAIVGEPGHPEGMLAFKETPNGDPPVRSTVASHLMHGCAKVVWQTALQICTSDIGQDPACLPKVTNLGLQWQRRGSLAARG